MSWFLGIDTSCYTTSVAAIDCQGKLLADCRKLLTVKPGGRGLSQSEMVYQHTRQLPALLAQAMSKVGEGPAAIGVTTCPRPLAGSYMPAFLVGSGYAQAMAISQRVPLFVLSHQENHVLAALWSIGQNIPDRFLAIHASGGTTELVLCESQGHYFSIQPLGKTLDLNAGQFVDRIGVRLDLPFPAGRHLEKLAQTANGLIKLPVAVRGFNLSFAGPASQAERLINQGCSAVELARAVELCIGQTLQRIILAAATATGVRTVVLAGGVMSNTFIRNHLLVSLEQLNILIPAAEYSPDNAVGAAVFCLA